MRLFTSLYRFLFSSKAKLVLSAKPTYEHNLSKYQADEPIFVLSDNRHLSIGNGSGNRIDINIRDYDALCAADPLIKMSVSQGLNFNVRFELDQPPKIWDIKHKTPEVINTE